MEPVQSLQAVPHGGMQGLWRGQVLRLGNDAFSGVAQAASPQATDIPLTRLGLSLDGRPLAVFDIAETLRPGVHEALQSLMKAGAEVAVLSGDAPATVQAWGESSSPRACRPRRLADSPAGLQNHAASR